MFYPQERKGYKPNWLYPSLFCKLLLTRRIFPYSLTIVNVIVKLILNLINRRVILSHGKVSRNTKTEWKSNSKKQCYKEDIFNTEKNITNRRIMIPNCKKVFSTANIKLLNNSFL